MPEIEMNVYWDDVYDKVGNGEASWHQPVPAISLELLAALDLPKNTSLIDVGGGTSRLVDNLMDLGFSDLTVLDISERGIESSKMRLGKRADLIKWIQSDINDFKTEIQYGCWHDRAVFHFLTDEKDVQRYVHLAEKAIHPGGYLVVGTFSEKGPEKCSGLCVRRYSVKELTDTFGGNFEKVSSRLVFHTTPSGINQHFTFCSFRRSLSV